MQINGFLANKWSIYGACDSRGKCMLLDWLNRLDGSQKAERDGLLTLLERVSKTSADPSQYLPSEKCHTITSDIHQFRRGNLRILYFYDEGKKIICTHGFKKAKNKTPRGEIRKATRIYEEYVRAKSEGNLEIQGEGDDC